MALPTLSTLTSRATRVASRSEQQAEMESTLHSLGYTSSGRSTGNKFVEAVGTTSSCLVAYYGGYGGHQVEAGSPAAQAQLIERLTQAGVRAVPAGNGWNKVTREEILHETRVALGGKDNLAKALKVLIGEPKVVTQVTTVALSAVQVDDDIALIAAAAKAKREREAAKVDPREADIAKLKALGFEQVDIDAALKAKYGA